MGRFHSQLASTKNNQLAPRIAPFSPVTVDVVGPGCNAGFTIAISNAPTQQQYIYGNLLLVFVTLYTQGPIGGNPCTISVGGQTMKFVSAVLNYVNVVNQAQSALLYLLWNPPQGLQTISNTANTGYNSALGLNAISFRNVGSVGRIQTASGTTTSISQTVTGLENNGLIFNAMTSYSSGYSGTIASTQQVLLGTSTSGNISATASANAWSSFSLPLNPLPFPPALPELYNQVPVTMSRGAYL